MTTQHDLSRAVWRISSRSGDASNTCVEVARVPAVVAVRDSTDRGGPALVFSPSAWGDFLTKLKSDQI